MIACCLDKEEIEKFLGIANSINIECIVEIHNEDDLKKIEGSKIDIIGINNRNLKTFEVSIETSFRLRTLLPEEAVVISESGIKSREDIKRLKKMGFNGVLIGEVLLRSPSPGEKLRELLKGVND